MPSEVCSGMAGEPVVGWAGRGDPAVGGLMGENGHLDEDDGQADGDEQLEP